MRHYLEISFPFPIGKDPLTYHADAAGEEPPAPGTRVLVAVHGRRTVGYVAAGSPTPPEFATQPVGEILDPVPLFPAHLVALARWIARTCLCSFGEALNAMLPAGVKQQVQRFVTAGPGAWREAERPPRAAEALEWLATQGPTLWKAVVARFPAADGRLADWVGRNWVDLHHTLQRGAGPRLRQVLTVDTSHPLDLDLLTPKERLAVECLFRMNTAVDQATLCRQAGVSSAPIKQLLNKGFLKLHEERVFREVGTEAYYETPAVPPPTLSADQQRVLDLLKESDATDRKPVLVRGVTCSGKTEVYLRWVAEQLERQRSAIVLVPEISLTPQMVKRFRDRFGPRVAILHSRLGEGERFDQWERIRSGVCPVVVGARSAVFAPVPHLGTIILDEEGEPTFKQGESPRYHARDVAGKRCELEGALLVMGSATPTMDAFARAQEGVFHLVEMPTRVRNLPPPQVTVVDMRHELTARHNRSIFSATLSEALQATLAAGRQAILYLNRRGHSSFVLCRACGETVMCSRCQVSLVFHTGCRLLRCHYCGEAREVPKTCPVCASEAIRFFGAGTQRIEEETRRYFPQARLARLDSDTVGHKGDMEDLLDRFGRGEIDILIGTQMVAKGLDFPGVTLVGIMAADGLLRLPDFRASERNFALLAQVAGRAGRGDAPGRVILQTYFPQHHSITFALTEDYHGFFAEEARHRKSAGFPPYLHLASFLIAGEPVERAQNAADQLAEALRRRPGVAAATLLGPAPAPLERLNGQYRFQLLVKMTDLETLLDLVRPVLTEVRPSGVRITADIDPFFSL